MARYLTPGSAHRELGLVCLGVGSMAGKRSALVSRTLDCFAGVLVTRGRGWFRSAGVTSPVDAPAWLWLTPGVPHGYGPDDAGWNEWWVLFDGPATAAYARLGHLTPDRPLAALADPAPLELTFASLARACGRAEPDPLVEASALVHQLLAVLPRCRRDDTGHPKVLAALRARAYEALTVEDHARELGLTSGELRTAVREAAGCTPKQYLQRIRIDRAKELLATTDLPVAAVALRTGFADPAYFSRQFSRTTGESPARFRAAQRRP